MEADQLDTIRKESIRSIVRETNCIFICLPSTWRKTYRYFLTPSSPMGKIVASNGTDDIACFNANEIVSYIDNK